MRVRPMLRRTFRRGSLIVVGAILAAILWQIEQLSHRPPDFEDACESGRPYWVTACYRAQLQEDTEPSWLGPSILLFRDTPDNGPHFSLATYEQTGAVWGLDFSPARQSIYAASFLKRGLPHGPDGPGAIYRIDLVTGAVEHFATVPNAGDDVHRFGGLSREVKPSDDLFAAQFVGRRSLGDLEVDDGGGRLFTVHLRDRQIYVFSLQDGTLLHRFPHGADALGWSSSARPFGLAWHDGRLFHGVVNEDWSRDPVAHVYSSVPDGSDMQRVAVVDLSYERDTVSYDDGRELLIPWGAWWEPTLSKRTRSATDFGAMPMLTDIELSSDGDMVLGLRDRRWDVFLGWFTEIRGTGTGTGTKVALSRAFMGFGDILRGTRSGDTWSFITDPKHFDDTNGLGDAESMLGGLGLHEGTGEILTGAFGIEMAEREQTLGWEGGYWLGVAEGNKRRSELLCRPGTFESYRADQLAAPLAEAHSGERPPPLPGPPSGPAEWVNDTATIGDAEPLCIAGRPSVPATATALPSPTVVPSFTPAPSASAPPEPTATGTRLPEPLYLPLLLREQCEPERVRSDIVLVIDASSSMAGRKLAAAKEAASSFIGAVRMPPDRVAVVAFDRQARVVSDLSASPRVLQERISEIDVQRGTRIDRGLAAARDILVERPPSSDRQSVVVLLTDGIQEEDLEVPLRIARDLRASGTALFGIGLGGDVDRAYLSELIVSRGRLYFSPEPADLESVYLDIARKIPCPPEATWGGR